MTCALVVLNTQHHDIPGSQITELGLLPDFLFLPILLLPVALSFVSNLNPGYKH